MLNKGLFYFGKHRATAVVVRRPMSAAVVYSVDRKSYEDAKVDFIGCIGS